MPDALKLLLNRSELRLEPGLYFRVVRGRNVGLEQESLAVVQVLQCDHGLELFTKDQGSALIRVVSEVRGVCPHIDDRAVPARPINRAAHPGAVHDPTRRDQFGLAWIWHHPVGKRGLSPRIAVDGITHRIGGSDADAPTIPASV